MTEVVKSEATLDAEITNQVSGGALNCSHIGALTALGTGNGLVGAAVFLACEAGGPASGSTVGMSDIQAP